jgi:hypothetical protein
MRCCISFRHRSLHLRSSFSFSSRRRSVTSSFASNNSGSAAVPEIQRARAQDHLSCPQSSGSRVRPPWGAELRRALSHHSQSVGLQTRPAFGGGDEKAERLCSVPIWGGSGHVEELPLTRCDWPEGDVPSILGPGVEWVSQRVGCQRATR